MELMNSTFRLTVVSAALIAAFGPVVAEESEVDQYIKPDSSVSLGVGNWSGDRHQLGIYDGMREKGTYGLIDADVVKRNDQTGTWYMLKTQNLGLDSREARIEVLRQGDIGGFLEYSRTPRETPFTINTGLRGLGTANQVVSGSGINALPKRDVELGTRRDMTRLGFFKNLLPGLDFVVDFRNEEKKGERMWSFGSAHWFLAEPIDSNIRQLEAILKYESKSLQLSGGYYGSWFDQNNGGLVRASVNGAAASTTNPTWLSQPLGNHSHQVFLDGGYNFTPTTRGTFKVSYSRAFQDEHLPTADVLPLAVGAPSSLDGQVNTTLVQLGLSSKPLPKLSLSASLRYHDMDDKTPLARFVSPTVGDPYSVWNTPHSFTKTSGKVEATYRLPENFSLTGGVEYYKQDRSVPRVGSNATVGIIVVPYRSELDETTYRLQLRRSLGDNLNGSIAYLRSDRDGSSRTDANGRYSAGASTNTDIQNRYNPMHIADRTRDKLRAKLDWEPMDRLSLQFGVESSQDDYGPSRNQFGLIDGKATLYSVDASYLFNDDWKLTGWLSHEDTRSRQKVASTPVNDVRLSEKADSVGLGLRGKLSAKLDMGADVEWLRSVSKFDQSGTFSATFRPLPEIENKVTRFKLNGTYALEKNADIRVDLVHERWHTDDWTWNFADGSPYASRNAAGVDGTTVLFRPNQVSDFIAVRYIYKFQ